MIVPRYYEDLRVLHENTMPARAYFIPASKRMDNLVEHREESDRMQLLNGTWKFQYFNSIYDVQKHSLHAEPILQSKHPFCLLSLHVHQTSYKSHNDSPARKGSDPILLSHKAAVFSLPSSL